MQERPNFINDFPSFTCKIDLFDYYQTEFSIISFQEAVNFQTFENFAKVPHVLIHRTNQFGLTVEGIGRIFKGKSIVETLLLQFCIFWICGMKYPPGAEKFFKFLEILLGCNKTAPRGQFLKILKKYFEPQEPTESPKDIDINLDEDQTDERMENEETFDQPESMHEASSIPEIPVDPVHFSDKKYDDDDDYDDEDSLVDVAIPSDYDPSEYYCDS